MTATNQIKSINQILWLGPQVFLVEFVGGQRVFLRRDNRGWYACSSVEETFDGGTLVTGVKSDLLEAGEAACVLANKFVDLRELEHRRRNARQSTAESWAYYIQRGSSGKGAAGAESTGENLIIELAATLLPCGMPALSFLDRFSESEIDAIRDAMKLIGMDGWLYPLVDRHSKISEASKS